MLKKIMLISIIFSSCQNQRKQISNIPVDSTQKENLENSIRFHLKDTAFVQGNCVVFLRPDSTGFESNKNEEGIYEVDSDFGFGLSRTIDTIKNDKHLKKIKPYVITERFIIIKECESCPKIIDRDTIDYGILLISKQKGLQIEQGILMGDYVQLIRDYFK